uniref:DUF659 domain-containing protein n=1 Tax=Rhodnius prolixus TaxID=13249 RepID=T1H8U3_RHOPR
MSTDLCRALVRAAIPFHKLKNPHFKGFLETYIGKKMPDESALRKNYLEDVYKGTLTKIRELIKDGPIWVSIDETTDVEGRSELVLRQDLAFRSTTIANLESGTISGKDRTMLGNHTLGIYPSPASSTLDGFLLCTLIKLRGLFMVDDPTEVLTVDGIDYITSGKDIEARVDIRDWLTYLLVSILRVSIGDHA